MTKPTRKDAKMKTAAKASKRNEANAPLRYKPVGKSQFLRLPFVTTYPRKTTRFFDVPPIPGDDETKRYATGCKVGHKLAVAYLKHLREYEGGGLQSLQHIVLDIAEHGADRGVVVGFFWCLGEWLSFAAKKGGAGLDGVSESEIEAELAALVNGGSRAP